MLYIKKHWKNVQTKASDMELGLFSKCMRNIRNSNQYVPVQYTDEYRDASSGQIFITRSVDWEGTYGTLISMFPYSTLMNIGTPQAARYSSPGLWTGREHTELLIGGKRWHRESSPLTISGNIENP